MTPAEREKKIKELEKALCELNRRYKTKEKNAKRTKARKLEKEYHEKSMQISNALYMLSELRA